MTKLRAPLHEQLSPHVDESAVQRIWSGVRARRGGSLFAKRPASPFVRYGLVLAAAIAVALLVDAGLRNRAARAPLMVAAGPLVSRAGAAIFTLGGEVASRDELSDGSSIRLDPGSRLEVLENTAKSFVTVLRSGRGAFAVEPGGPRRWTIEAGIATVEVVGTRFSVARHPASVDVEVEHGVVLVRSDLIADHVQRLGAGQRLSIRLPQPSSVASPAPDATAPPTHSAVPVTSPPLPAPTLQSLLGLANEQRRHGDLRGAESSLRRALEEHPSSPQAALVGFTLGKLLLDSAGRPADAAIAFERCLAASPPSALAEDALFRAAEARARAGQADLANARAREYRSRYPSGRYVRDIERWLIER